MEFFDELANTYCAQDNDNSNMCDGIYTEGIGDSTYTQAVFE